MNSISTDYYAWMCKKIEGSDKRRLRSHSRLLEKLHYIDFEYSIPMDENRYWDGIELRYRFGYEKKIDKKDIELYLDGTPPSILEVMVALSIRCEEHIMDNNKDDRTSVWFWDMVKSLKLYDMTDDVFDPDAVQEVITRFLDHEYGRDGEGGLFTVKGYEGDMRKEEIWYQMMRYLNKVYTRGNPI